MRLLKNNNNNKLGCLLVYTYINGLYVKIKKLHVEYKMWC